MKRRTILGISASFAFAALAVVSIVHAQSPREQLQQLVEQLQKSPTDNALREKIIKLAATLQPAPAIPEEARRSYVEGVTIVKSAKEAEQKLAIESFNEALKIAPWWGDAYHGLAVAQELTGQLDSAERALKWFIVSNPGESEARDAQDRIYAIGAKRKLAAAEAAAKQEKADLERKKQEAKLRTTEGDWYRSPDSTSAFIKVIQQNGRFKAQYEGDDHCTRYMKATATTIEWEAGAENTTGTCEYTYIWIYQCQLSGETTLDCQEKDPRPGRGGPFQLKRR